MFKRITIFPLKLNDGIIWVFVLLGFSEMICPLPILILVFRANPLLAGLFRPGRNVLPEIDFAPFCPSHVSPLTFCMLISSILCRS
jgi:hypothetical protein